MPEYANINFRRHPELYHIGRGEQGVLTAEPYKGELLPLWRFATPEAARASSAAIYERFETYGREGDFVGMDLARKFLQMGFTRARRYANHPNGRKYDAAGEVRPQAPDALTSPKAQAAATFYEAYQRALADPRYRELKARHLARQG